MGRLGHLGERNIGKEEIVNILGTRFEGRYNELGLSPEQSGQFGGQNPSLSAFQIVHY